MGTLGCIPAYDRYFVSGIRKLKVASGIYNLNSVMQLVEFYEQEQEALEKVRSSYVVYDLRYPQMKLIDMMFWQVGYDEENHGLES